MKKYITNKKELAELINVDVKTLSNWEKNKPELIRLIMMGLVANQSIEEMMNCKDRIEQLKIKNAEDVKLKLK